MANSEHVEILKDGAVAWNQWRERNSSIAPDLSDIKFLGDIYVSDYIYDLPHYIGYDFSRCNLNRSSMRNCTFTLCNFSNCRIHYSDLVDSYCDECDFSHASLRVSKIGSAEFIACNFTCADLSYCSAEETNFAGSKLVATNLSNMSLVKTDFTNTLIDEARVYGISAWDLILHNSKQSNIYIEEETSSITVPNIELAQFVSLLIRSSKIRDIIDTITSKVVLILGSFSDERKFILENIKEELQTQDYLPILFDFEGPRNRDITETVLILATMAKFVVADLSSPRSIPQELTSIIPNFPSIPVQPIIEKSQNEYGMFEHFQRYPWVLNTLKYSENDVHTLVCEIIEGCENHLITET